MLGIEDINRRFGYFAPDEARALDHTTVRTILANVAEQIDRLCPDGREKATAITKLEEAMYWANAALARPSHKKHRVNNIPNIEMNSMAHEAKPNLKEFETASDDNTVVQGIL